MTSKTTTSVRPSARYAGMTKAEYDLAAARFEPPNAIKGKLLSKAEWARMKRAAVTERRKRGRPRKAEEQKVARVLISMPRDLLAAIDAAAAHRDVTRAALIADGMRRLLKLPA